MDWAKILLIVLQLAMGFFKLFNEKDSMQKKRIERELINATKAVTRNDAVSSLRALSKLKRLRS